MCDKYILLYFSIHSNFAGKYSLVTNPEWKTVIVVVIELFVYDYYVQATDFEWAKICIFAVQNVGTCSIIPTFL